MRKWYENWGVWIIAVVALICFGIVIGWDITEFSGASSAFAAIGTLMLGVAALLAIPQWKQQEQKRFQASIASAMHAALAAIRHQLDNPVYYYQAAVSLSERDETVTLKDSQQQNAKLRVSLEEKLYELASVLNGTVIPRAALLGLRFSEDARQYAHELAMFLGLSDWDANGFERMNSVVDGLDELLSRLENIVLFKA